MMAAPTNPTPAHCATDDAARKAFAKLGACAALAGYTCTRTSIGNIVLSRLGYASIFGDVASASAWLDGALKPIKLDRDHKKTAAEVGSHLAAKGARSSATLKDKRNSAESASIDVQRLSTVREH